MAESTLRARIGVPTARTDWRRMTRTSVAVLHSPVWFAVAALGAAGTVSLFVIPQHLGYLTSVVLGGSLPLTDRVTALVRLYPLVGGDDPLRGVALGLVGSVVGLDVALVGYHFVNHEVGIREGSGGSAGLVLAGIGAGCPACGAGLAAGALSTAGIAGGLAVLPLHDGEFLVLAVAAAVCSIHWTVEGMRGAEVRGCPVDLSDRGA